MLININMARLVTGAVANTVNYLTSYYNDYNTLGQDKEILTIGNVLNSIFVNRDNISIPQIVTIGSQSSGKSSILNSILGIDILPTGSNMVTRTPLQLELIQSIKDVKAVFGEYVNGDWITIKTISIQYPDPTPAQKDDILSMIKSITKEYAGKDMNISDKPIYLKVYSPNIPNLSLVDLPGLTMVACTDRGQPSDIKDRIRQLLIKYIKKPNTIILCIMPARTDIEADIALDLVKEVDSSGERTIGILTKMDLMNEGTDITEYLENKVSKDLQLKLGYFGIKNRNKIEMGSMNVLEGLKAEYDYFRNHRIYSNLKYKDNLGIPSLCKHLSNVLVKALKRNIPSILEKINLQLMDNKKELSLIGEILPKDDIMKVSLIHENISDISRKYIVILEERGNHINTGSEIKKCFIKYRNELDNLNLFDNKECSDYYLESIVSKCEGNHMSFPVPSVEVLELIFKDKERKPLNKTLNISYKCVQEIVSLLTQLIENVIQDSCVKRFPNFSKIIKTIFVNEVLLPRVTDIHKILEDEINCQNNYIWTEDVKFRDSLRNCNRDNFDIIRQLSKQYFEAIIYILKDLIPKKIMYYLVLKTQELLPIKLYDKIKLENPNYILAEFSEVNEKRKTLDKNIKDLDKAKTLIETIM